MSYSVLRPPPQPLALPLLASMTGHGCVVLFAAALTAVYAQCAPSRSIIDIDDAIEVSLVVLPKSESDMPNRASRAPVPVAPAPAPAAPPPPIRESELVVHTPKAKPRSGTPDRTRERQQAMERLLRDQLLDDLTAPDGAVDQHATDPNSTSDEAINATGPGLAADPEYARYVSRLSSLFKANFRPLAAVTQANPDLSCVVFITVTIETGSVESVKVTRSSGNALFDDAALTAARSVTTVPMPPEKYRRHMAAGYEFTYTAKD